MATLAMSAAEREVNGIPYVQLNNGTWMPRFGLGTFRIPDNATCKDAVLTALRMGYRHIDTAHAYMDEQGVGDAVSEFVRESGVKGGWRNLEKAVKEGKARSIGLHHPLAHSGRTFRHSLAWREIVG